MKKTLAAFLLMGTMLLLSACGIDNGTTTVTSAAAADSVTVDVTEAIAPSKETIAITNGSQTESNDDVLHIYTPVIMNCQKLEHFNEKGYSLEDINRIDTYQIYKSCDLIMCNLGYALIDLDGDGTEELMIGCADENDFGPHGGEIIIAMFGIEDGKPVKIFESWARNRHYLYTNNTILQRGSNGASATFSEIFRLEDNELLSEKRLWSNGIDEKGNLLVYYCEGGNCEEGEKTRITKEQSKELGKDFSDAPIPLPSLIPVC